MKAVSYVRVSTAEQASEGISLSAQRHHIEAYARFRRLEVVEEVVDAGVSAGKPLRERPGGQRLFELAAQPEITAVVALKLDRLFRDAADCLTITRRWDELSVDLHLVDMGGQAVDTSSAMGRFFLTIMAAVAEMERNLIRERTRTAMAHLKRQGRRISPTPYGKTLTDDGLHLVDDPNELAMMARAQQLRGQGLSLRKVAEQMASEGMVDRRGRALHPQQVKRLLTSTWGPAG